MEEKIRDYLRLLQSISLMKGDDEIGFMPYGFDNKRAVLHDELFQEILPSLNLVEGFSENDAYWRSKEIFARLDKVFALYNDFDLDLKNTEHIQILTEDLERFLGKTETKYYLEGRINGLTKVIEND